MAAGDNAYWSDVADLIEKPMVRLVAQSAQSLTDNTATAITFGASSEDFDTHNFHDTSSNTSRVTPTVAGYYRCRGAVLFGARNDYAVVNCWIRVNGSSNKPSAWRAGYGVPGSAQVQTGLCEVVVSLNGSTDYVELVAQQDNTANAAVALNQSGQYSSTLEVEYLRPL